MNAGPRDMGLAVGYSNDLLIALTLTAGLNILDSLFTMMILDEGGREINPVVQAAMLLWGDRFWIWKFFLVSGSLIFLCFYSYFRYVKAIIFGISILYVAVVLYQIVLLTLIHSL